jgi:hypothetical protein
MGARGKSMSGQDPTLTTILLTTRVARPAQRKRPLSEERSFGHLFVPGAYWKGNGLDFGRRQLTIQS